MKKSFKADVRNLYSREGCGELTADLYRQCTLLSFSSLDPRCWLHRDVFREDKRQGQEYHRFVKSARIHWHYAAAELLNS